MSKYHVDSFDGDFLLLSLRAFILFGNIPHSPDFQSAAVSVAYTEDVAGIWWLEAVRERCQRPGCVFDNDTIQKINLRTADRLYSRSRHEQAMACQS